MPLIDNRGRLFGRLNIIDAALIVFVVVLLPIGYTAVRLFRLPRPQIESVEPAQQPIGPERRIRLHGRDFRPYLRVFVNRTGQPFSLVDRLPTAIEGQFLVETPSLVEIVLPKLTVGQYDVYLYDETQEVARRQGAFELTPLPEMTVRARIRFSVPFEAIAFVHEGDHDLFDRSGASPVQNMATLKTIRRSPKEGAALELLNPFDAAGSLGVVRSQTATLEADVDIPAVPNVNGVPEYHGWPVRVGDPFVFQTAQYAIRGLVSAIAEPK